MMPAFELSPVHKLIFRYLEMLLSGDIRKLWISTPPRHGKSTTGSIMLPAFALGRNAREAIIQVSYGSDLAEGFGRRVRNILSDPAFRELFPTCQLSPDSQAAYRFETTQGGEYSAVGRGGPVTGRGASLLILDDLLKDQAEANSEATCRSIIEWLQSVAFTRLTPNGRVLAIATRWSERDPMGWLASQAGWTILNLPAFAEANDPLNREPGQALWPSRYPIEVLEKIRTDIGSRTFACLFQGNVAAAQGSVFKRDWFRHYQAPPEKFKRIIQSWDTAFKSGATNDYSVGFTIGETDNGFYFLSRFKDKVEFPELKRQVAQQADFWHPHEILVEDKASGQSLIQELKLATSYPVIAVKVDRDKETRASAITGYFESGRVFFPEGAAWTSDLEDELASFPGGLHDDQIDAVSQALNRLRDQGGLGLVELLKRFARGERQMPPSVEERLAQITQPAHTRSEGNKGQRPDPGPCPACGSTATVWLAGGLPDKPPRVLCNQCSRIDGVSPGEPETTPGHTHVWRSIPGGEQRCDDCGQQRGGRYVPVGMNRRGLKRRF
jgi:predicted phage terminase large subunit-like protein